MDRRIYDMLDKYARSENFVRADNFPNECLNKNYCLDTDYKDDKSGILTMAFVNMQPLESVYETEDGFPRGTIFPNIDKPFYGGVKR